MIKVEEGDRGGGKEDREGGKEDREGGKGGVMTFSAFPGVMGRTKMKGSRWEGRTGDDGEV